MKAVPFKVSAKASRGMCAVLVDAALRELRVTAPGVVARRDSAVDRLHSLAVEATGSFVVEIGDDGSVRECR